MIAHHLAQLGRHLLERERILAAPDRLCVRCMLVCFGRARTHTQSWLVASGRLDTVIACKGSGAEEGFQGLMIYISFLFRGSPCWLYDAIMHLLGMHRHNVYANKPFL